MRWWHLVLAIFFITTSTLELVSADYASWPTANHNEYANRKVLTAGAYDVIANSSVIGQVSNPTGVYLTQSPLVIDTDGDGTPEIWAMATNDTLGVFDPTTGGLLATAFVGEQLTQPTSCDYDGDGKTEYITLIREGVYPTLFGLKYHNGTITSVEDWQYVANEYNGTQPSAILACGTFGTGKAIFYKDINGILWKNNQTGNIKTHNAIDVSEGSLDARDNAPTFTAARGQSDVLLLTDFDKSNKNTVLFTSGLAVFAYYDDGDMQAENFSDDLGPNTQEATFDGNAYTSVNLLGVTQNTGSNTKKAVIVSVDGQIGTLTYDWLGKLQSTNFLSKNIGITATRETPSLNTGGNTNDAMSITAQPGADGVDNLYVARRKSANPRYSFETYRATNLVNVSPQYLYGDGSAAGGSFDAGNATFKTVLSDVNKDGSYDVVFQNGTGDNDCIEYFDYTEGQSTKIYCFDVTDSGNGANGVSEGNFLISDLDRDGTPDILSYSGAGLRWELSQQGAQRISKEFPFEVIQNATSSPNSASIVVTAGFNNTERVYNYALVCDIKERTVYSEIFNGRYDFASRNVTTQKMNASEDLTPFSLVLKNEGSDDYVDLFKVGIEDSRESLKQTLVIAVNSSSSYYLVNTENSGAVTSFYKFTYNSTNIMVSKVFLGFGEQPLGNLTVINGFTTHTITIQYIPSTDQNSAINYFKTLISIDDNLIAANNTIEYPGVRIKNTDFFSNSTNTKFTITSLSLSATKDLFPPSIQFQNGELVTQNFTEFRFANPQTFYDYIGCIISPLTQCNPTIKRQTENITNIPPQFPFIDGQGYTVVPEYNQLFYGVCNYDQPGTYTTRNYILPLNSFDYSNYKDLVVIVTNGTTINGANGVLPNAPGGDNTIRDLILAVVGGSLAFAFLLWFVLDLVISYFAFRAHPLFGLLAFAGVLVAGYYPVGIIPFWVMFTLFIVDAAIFVVALRLVFGGK